MTNESGNFERSYLYGEFGNLRAAYGSVANHYLYTGQEYDDEIAVVALYNLRARYYNQNLGRFISEDPAITAFGRPQSTNQYLYVENTPTLYTDPTGLYSACRVLIHYPVSTTTENSVKVAPMSGN